MQFPFIELRPGVFCPVIALHFRGPGGEVVSDGLLDTGSERTLITTKLARSLGIDPDQLPTAFQLRSATGHSSSCKMSSLSLQLRRDNESISWMAEVLIGPDSLPINLWGFKGFLEYFDTLISGPNRTVQLIASQLLPKINPPS